jgi:hypothetical protein
MEFFVPCSCGEFVTVTEGSAGTNATCVCGQPVQIPSLATLRQLAGMPAHQLSPETVIEHMLLARELPSSTSCAQCGVATDKVTMVRVECERVLQTNTQGATCFGVGGWLAAPYYAILHALERNSDNDSLEYGRDKIYELPVPLCTKCQPSVTSPAALKMALARVPDYRNLLDKFPEANVSI